MSEKSGLPIYCESSPTTFTMYQKFGFKILKEKLIHSKEVLGTEDDIDVPLMVRMPAAAGQLSFEEWQELGYPSWENVPITNKVVEDPKIEPIASARATTKDTAGVQVISSPVSTSTESSSDTAVASEPAPAQKNRMPEKFGGKKERRRWTTTIRSWARS